MIMSASAATSLGDRGRKSGRGDEAGGRGKRGVWRGRESASVEENHEPGRSRLERLAGGGGHDGVFDLVVPYLSGRDIFRGIAVTSKKLAAAARGGGRRWLKRRHERGEKDAQEKGDEEDEPGRADIEDAARWGYRPAIAACKFLGWSCETDEGGAAALWRAELASKPSEKSGGKCRWSAYELAQCYEHGFGGVERNVARAVELYHEAADEGRNRAAMDFLADAYERGEMGLDEDEAKALKYLRSASDAGFAYASARLGERYESGKLGLDINLAEAARLYNIARERCTFDTAQWTKDLRRVQRKIAGTYESADEESSDDADEEEEEEEEDWEDEEDEEDEEEDEEEEPQECVIN